MLKRLLQTLTMLLLVSALGACAWMPILGRQDEAADAKAAASAMTEAQASTEMVGPPAPSTIPKATSVTLSPDVKLKPSARKGARKTAAPRLVAVIPPQGASSLTDAETDAETEITKPPRGAAKAKKQARSSVKSRPTAVVAAQRKAKNKRGPLSKDLWGRIRGRMALADLEHPRIDEYIEKLKHNPGYLNLFAQRGRPYLHYLVDHIDRSGLPLDLIAVPMVESAFQTTAVSTKEAAGLWQIIPSTGREHGLVLAEGYDGRLDIHTSTDAALRYLRYLHKLFRGDWLLALAAYNAGPGAVQNAIRTRPADPPPTPAMVIMETHPALLAALGPARLASLAIPATPPPPKPQSLFWSLRLPKETQDYVPRIVALAHVVANPGRYGIKLQSIANQPYLYRVELTPETKMFDSITAAGISNEDFLRFNPGFKPGVEPPVQTYRVLLPREQAESLVANAPGTRLLAPSKHTVQQGETLEMIAQRHGVSSQKLAQWNRLNTRRALKAGQQLIVYPSSS
ncbi:MAG: transglycosylase SLT domain-containing protein [Candidatus Contendobacter sp.]